jgi:hypothetical protein
MTAPSALIEVVRQQRPTLAPEASFGAERGDVLVPVPAHIWKPRRWAGWRLSRRGS